LVENKNQLKMEFLDFSYSIINPLNLIGIDEFNQSFFDKIDQIEIDISNDIKFETIIANLDIESKSVSNFKVSSKSNEIEKKNL
jgi:peptidyl-prolyl cis-trans isomerase D